MKDQASIIESCQKSINQLITAAEYKEAIDLYETIRRELFAFLYKNRASHHPEFVDQLERASLSIVLNIAEGIGNGRGYMINHYLHARGSAYEVWSLIQVSPYKALLTPKIEKVILEIEATILAVLDT